jgi:hypothetical protein
MPTNMATPMSGPARGRLEDYFGACDARLTPIGREYRDLSHLARTYAALKG